MQTQLAAIAPDLAAFLTHERDTLALAWAELVCQIPESQYRDTPLDQVQTWMARRLDAISGALTTGSFDRLETHLIDVSLTRLQQELPLGEEIEGLLLCKEAALPLIWDHAGGNAALVMRWTAQLDACLRHIVGRFAERYAAIPLQHMGEQEQRTVLMLDTAQLASSSLEIDQALALDTAQLYRQLRRQLAESESLQRVTAALLRQRSLADVLEIVCGEAQRLTGASGSMVVLLEDDAPWLRVVHAAGEPIPALERLPLDGSFAGLAIRQGQPQVTNDPAHEPQVYRDRRAPQQLLAVPLRIAETPIGAIDLLNKPGGFHADDVRIVNRFADQAAIAIQNARLHERIEQLAAVAERQRLAHDLHDSVAQSLYSLTLYAEAAAGALGDGEPTTATAHLREMERIAHDALREMRLLIFNLRPPVLEHEGLVAALQARLDAVEAPARLQTELRCEGDERLPLPVKEALYHIAQEALNNVLKHAQARRVTVRLRFGDTTTQLAIVDDGQGFDVGAAASGGGFGLRGMEERVQQLGGRLAIRSAPGTGTCITVEVPR